MTTPNLAKIERVDLRDAWPNEARDFTPWLAENIAELGEALGMDLELQQTEASVGGYSLDVLATDLGQKRSVVIENQLGPTNHDHLGKVLTYAAGYDASVIVWLTQEFRDEHRQAMDWLNQRTGEDTQFFGVVVELLRIDDSRPAPQFRIVSMPNGWRKEAAALLSGKATATLSPRAEKYRAFFQRLLDTLREEHRFTNAKIGQPQNFYSFSLGYGSRVTFVVRFTGYEVVTVELYIDSPDEGWNSRLFHALQESERAIEESLGEDLLWDHGEGRRSCSIVLGVSGKIDDEDEILSNIHDWMVEYLLKFRIVFRPHLDNWVSRIQLSQEQPTIE